MHENQKVNLQTEMKCSLSPVMLCYRLTMLSFITGENHFPRHEDEQDDSRLHHAVDEARKQLRLVTVDTNTHGSLSYH